MIKTQDYVESRQYELDARNKELSKLRQLYEDEFLDCCDLNNYNIYDEFSELSGMYIFDEKVQSKVVFHESLITTRKHLCFIQRINYDTRRL